MQFMASYPAPGDTMPIAQNGERPTLAKRDPFASLGLASPGEARRIMRSISGLIVCGCVVSAAACASAGTAPAYQVTTSTAAPPPLAPPIPKPSAALSGGPPGLSPAQSTIVGTPSTKVSVSSSGADITAAL